MKRFVLSALLSGAFTAACGQALPVGEMLAGVAEGSAAVWGIAFRPDVAVLYPASNRMEFYRQGEEGVESDTWDRALPAANSTAIYRGRRYVTLVGDWIDRNDQAALRELLAHESFHYYQDSLGIPAVTSANAHLDAPEGRALLHMEFDALRKALRGKSRALRNALAIRRTRRALFPHNNEAAFELHEGLAQYTGLRIGRDDVPEHVTEALRFRDDRGYTNSFAYATGPAYALLLERFVPRWLETARSGAGLSELLAEHLSPSAERPATQRRAYRRLLKAERRTVADTERYARWTDDPKGTLRIPNTGIGIRFNPQDRVVPLGGRAVLLRDITLQGAWGTLTVLHGAVRRNDWTEFIVEAPRRRTENLLTGDDYRLELAPGWQAVDSCGVWRLRQAP